MFAARAVNPEYLLSTDKLVNRLNVASLCHTSWYMDTVVSGFLALFAHAHCHHSHAYSTELWSSCEFQWQLVRKTGARTLIT